MYFSLMLDPEVWAPHYWFVLQTIALSYPEWPTDTAKKKYYDLIHNFPLFVPSGEASLVALLDEYPVTPYLDSRESFQRWIHFIYNKILVQLGRKEVVREEADVAYWAHYIPKETVSQEERRRKRRLATGAVILGMGIAAVILAARGEFLEL